VAFNSLVNIRIVGTGSWGLGDGATGERGDGAN
jgi:hypothetical protein